MTVYQIAEQKAAIRKLNEQLIHIEGWGGPLKTFDDVKEYYANAIETRAEIKNSRESYKNNFLLMYLYLSFKAGELKIGHTSILDIMNNNYISMARYAERSYKREIEIIEAWLKVSKAFFK